MRLVELLELLVLLVGHVLPLERLLHLLFLAHAQLNKMDNGCTGRRNCVILSECVRISGACHLYGPLL